MSYAYGMQGAPAVGNGLGGLPVRKISSATSGRRVFLNSTTWTVPIGVYSVCAVCVGAGAYRDGSGTSYAGGNSSFGSFLTANGATNQNGATGGTEIGGNVGGGNGGNGGNGDGSYYPGAGGAGGYLGNGGNGANAGSTPTAGTDGQGGAGAGGSAGVSSFSPGGGVGIFGIGPSGIGNNTQNGGQPGSYGAGGQEVSGKMYSAFGAGNGVIYAGGGGALRWRNNIPVVPGQTISIVVGATSFSSASSGGGGGVVAVIWGEGRSFPYNAA